MEPPPGFMRPPPAPGMPLPVFFPPGFPPGMMPPPGMPPPWRMPPRMAGPGGMGMPMCDWPEHTTSDGKKYFYNAKMQESVWEKPKELEEFEKEVKQRNIVEKMKRVEEERTREMEWLRKAQESMEQKFYSRFGHVLAKQGEKLANESEELVTLRAEVRELSEWREHFGCPICMERKKDVVFLCGHATCSECVRHIRECYMCRRPIDRTIHLY